MTNTINELRIHSSAYQKGFKDGYEQGKKDERNRIKHIINDFIDRGIIITLKDLNKELIKDG